MQIASIPPDYTTSVLGPQGTPPPPAPSVTPPHKDKDGDHDHSTTTGADTNNGKQINVVA
jgi:hypothetical protein